jgi:S-adenosylmethionine decarboxylase
MSIQSQIGHGAPQGGVVGKHVYGNLYGVDPVVLLNEEFLRNLVIAAAEAANAHIVEVKSWKFTGGNKAGVSVIALVLESHIAIHTWPEYMFATVDIYTCGDHSIPDRAFSYIVSVLKPRNYTMETADRSSFKRD